MVDNVLKALDGCQMSDFLTSLSTNQQYGDSMVWGQFLYDLPALLKTLIYHDNTRDHLMGHLLLAHRTAKSSIQGLFAGSAHIWDRWIWYLLLAMLLCHSHKLPLIAWGCISSRHLGSGNLTPLASVQLLYGCLKLYPDQHTHTHTWSIASITTTPKFSNVLHCSTMCVMNRFSNNQFQSYLIWLSYLISDHSDVWYYVQYYKVQGHTQYTCLMHGQHMHHCALRRSTADTYI